MMKRIKTGENLISERSFIGRRPDWDLGRKKCARRIREAGSNRIGALLRSRTLLAPFLCITAAVAVASAQTAEPLPTVETIVARMAEARYMNNARFRPYTVTRDYKLFGKERQTTKARIIADVSFVPPTSKNYAIQQVNGTGFGEKVVRRMLASEVEIAKDFSATDFSSDNYDFAFIRGEHFNSQFCYVLDLLPKRKEKNLIRGSLWVDASTYLLRRAEGKPAKNPSWWVRNAHVALLYGNVGGMWLQTALEGTATVRILGSFTIVSSDVKYEISDLAAEQNMLNAINRGFSRIFTDRECPNPAFTAQPMRAFHCLLR